MSLGTMFTFLLLLVIVVVAVAVGAAVYIAVANQRTRRETGRELGTADLPMGTPTGVEPDEDEGVRTGRVEPRDREPRRELYKSIGLEASVFGNSDNLSNFRRCAVVRTHPLVTSAA